MAGLLGSGPDEASQGAKDASPAHATHLTGYLRVGAAVPPVRVTDVTGNRDATLALWREAHDAGVHAVWFPELGLASYTAGDLHLDVRLGQAVDEAVAWLQSGEERRLPAFDRGRGRAKSEALTRI